MLTSPADATLKSENHCPRTHSFRIKRDFKSLHGELIKIYIGLVLALRDSDSAYLEWDCSSLVLKILHR